MTELATYRKTLKPQPDFIHHLAELHSKIHWEYIIVRVINNNIEIFNL